MSKISKEDLFREIGEIDEAYVEEAERVKRTRRFTPRGIKTLAAVASLVLCVGVGYGALQLMNIGSGENNSSMAGGAGTMPAENSAMEEEVARDTEAVSAEASENAVGQAPRKEDGEAEGAPENAVGQAPRREDGEAEGAPENAVGQAASQGEPDLQDGPPSEETAQKDEMQQEITELEGGREPSNQNVTEETDLEILQQGAGGAADLTWEAARMDAVYGKYVDVQVPEGYTYTSGMRSAAGLHVIWNNGMEEISISCRQADESVSDWLADVDCPQEYDLGLYTIPWCDSVPEELHDKVTYATFAADQITPEIVAARTYQVEERGDESGYRTQIGILYSDNVLVEITSKGPAPEEIYSLLKLEN